MTHMNKTYRSDFEVTFWNNKVSVLFLHTYAAANNCTHVHTLHTTYTHTHTNSN